MTRILVALALVTLCAACAEGPPAATVADIGPDSPTRIGDSIVSVLERDGDELVGIRIVQGDRASDSVIVAPRGRIVASGPSGSGLHLEDVSELQVDRAGIHVARQALRFEALPAS